MMIIRVWKRNKLISGTYRMTVFSPLRYPVWCAKRQTKESTMSIDLVIGGDHGKGAFREIININEKFHQE